MPVRVKYNKLPEIIARLPEAVKDGLQDSGDVLVETLKPAVWHRWGYVEKSIQTYAKGEGITVGVGGSGSGSAGWGFYAIYQEFGTSKQGARPVVVPTAHAFEPEFANVVAEAVRRIL